LQKTGDDASLTRAAGYVTRVIDRVEKASPAEKPPQQSVAAWHQHQDQMRTALYAVRGNIEKSQRDYDAATKDLRQSYGIEPNAVAAIMLAEIAESRGDAASAIEEYSLAFALPEDGPAGKVDRRDIRKKLGNVWRQARGSDKGLGEEILATYDHLNASQARAAKDSPAARNRDAKSVFDFTLRQVNGAPLSMSASKGKVLALSFWATWCSPCRAVEPVFDQIAKGYAGNSKVEFLAVNTDEDESLVAPFLAHEKWSVPAAYADGLDALLDVETLPTIVVIDPGGKIVYRTTGFSTKDFATALTKAIDSAVTQAAPR
jgi:thiol-disulfide isomerase/thioredoxin